MIIVNSIEEINTIIKRKQSLNKTIGFVPTMGYLHEGHLSLIRAAAEQNDFVVISIFVNPIQFGKGEDFSQYPRNIKNDIQLAASAGANLVFNPSEKEMYPHGFKTYVEVEHITQKLCGASRPGHFKGVTTVVAKLLNIVQPDNAYFGQKDAQQVMVISQMVRDLNIDTNIIICPTVREMDGLAMSSRNKYLSKFERQDAVILSQTLFEARARILSGERKTDKIIDYVKDTISQKKTASIDYISILNADTLDTLDTIDRKVIIALAVKIGTTRLIDNIIIEV